MSAIHDATGAGQATVSTWRLAGLLSGFWAACRERRERREMQGSLSGLSDRELKDIGISRGGIDHVALNRTVDPRSACQEDCTVRSVLLRYPETYPFV